jgi:hypothetical protein
VLAETTVLPIRPLYDGLAPPAPYRYVKPPKDLADANQRPLPGRSTLELGKKGSAARTVGTADGQLLAIFADGSVPAGKGQREVGVDIKAIDPAPLPEAPKGLRIDGNAYVVRAIYRPSKEEAALREPVTVVLRYPTHATHVLQLRGRAWRKLKTQAAAASLQLFAETKSLGTFAAAGAPPASRTWIAYVAAAGGVLAGVAGFLTGRRRAQKPRRRRPRRRRPR